MRRGAGRHRQGRQRARHPPVDAPGSVHGSQLRGPRSSRGRRCRARGPGVAVRCDGARPGGRRRAARWGLGRWDPRLRSIASSRGSRPSRTARAHASWWRTTTGPSGSSTCVGLAERTGLRVVWDVLHHRCHDPAGLTDQDALAAALATWPDDVTPKIHYSSPRLDVEERRIQRGRRVERRLVLPQLRAHADLIDPIGFEQFLRDSANGRPFDVMLEAKAKDLALLRLRDQLSERGFSSERGRVRIVS